MKPGAVITLNQGASLSMTSVGGVVHSPGYEEEMRKQRLRYEQMLQEKLAKEQSKPMSTALTLPGEIDDAADSTDLLSQLEEINRGKIVDKKEGIWKKKQVAAAKDKIQNKYASRAKQYYENLWRVCRQKDGHSWITTEFHGRTVRVCECCSYADESSNYDNNGKHYNRELIDLLRNQLIKIDKEAGLYEEPKEEDFIYDESKLEPGEPIVIGYKKKRQWYPPWMLLEVPIYEGSS